jgi:peptidoglycan/xylan/chitin deacetylase (PgdA/CDA1 family)
LSFRPANRTARLVAALALSLSGAAAVRPGHVIASHLASAPLPITTASLEQQGRMLVWRVQLAGPFSPRALARDGRAVCLLLGNGRIDARVCVTGPTRGSRTPRLVYARADAAPSELGQPIAARVTRSSPRDLTASFLPAEVGITYAPLRWQVISSVRTRACGGSARSPSRCAASFPDVPRLLRLHEPQLVGCVPSGPTWVFHGPSDVRQIALTFDDGPWYDTPEFLTALEREHVVATFFQIGDQIAQYARHGLDRRMLADGDMIGDHTWDYGNDVAAGGRGAAIQITEAAAAIRHASGGFQPCLFRAPGGNASPALLRTARLLGFTTIQWDIDPRDWTTPGAAAIYDNVISNAHSGAIVIQHDGGGNRSQTLAALPREIHTLRREGYQFVTVTDMLGYRLLYR